MSLVRYDWDADKWNVLASSRRRPAQNQFDNNQRLSPFPSVFSGLQHRPCFTDAGTFYIREDEGTWEKVFEGDFPISTITVGDRSLVYSPSGAALLDANSATPEYWKYTYPRAAMERLAGPTDWPSSPRADFSTKGGSPSLGGIAFHKEDLFLLEDPGTDGQYHLLCYRKNDPQAPRRIPLAFHWDDQTRAILFSIPPAQGWPNNQVLEQIEHPDRLSLDPNLQLTPMLVTTAQGLCFKYRYAGFWFLPFTDIDAYLKSNTN